MTKKIAAEETPDEETTDETVEATEETHEETHAKKNKKDHEVAVAVNDNALYGNSQYDKPLFTGDLGGQVLLDSTPGASQFAASVLKNIG